MVHECNAQSRRINAPPRGARHERAAIKDRRTTRQHTVRPGCNRCSQGDLQWLTVRRITLVAAAVVALLAGCSDPGDLGDTWGALPSPSWPVAAVGTCLTSGGSIDYTGKGDPNTSQVGCDKPHKLEVVQTGRFPDAAQVSDWGSEPMQAAYTDCGTAATAYLGADWHRGWLFLHIGHPSSAAWSGGARTYVCDIAEFERTDWTAPALERTGTLKGDLATGGAGKVAQRCVKLSGFETDSQGFYSVATQKRVDCATLHDAEFAGVIEQPTASYPTWEAQRTFAAPRCDALVAAMLGLSTQALHERRRDLRSLFTYLDDETEWQAGEHFSICYAMVSTTHLVRATLKGLGSGPLPY
jgi:hypothetical protein